MAWVRGFSHPAKPPRIATTMLVLLPGWEFEVRDIEYLLCDIPSYRDLLNTTGIYTNNQEWPFLSWVKAINGSLLLLLALPSWTCDWRKRK